MNTCSPLARISQFMKDLAISLYFSRWVDASGVSEIWNSLTFTPILMRQTLKNSIKNSKGMPFVYFVLFQGQPHNKHKK